MSYAKVCPSTYVLQNRRHAAVVGLHLYSRPGQIFFPTWILPFDTYQVGVAVNNPDVARECELPRPRMIGPSGGYDKVGAIARQAELCQRAWDSLLSRTAGRRRSSRTPVQERAKRRQVASLTSNRMVTDDTKDTANITVPAILPAAM
jgi:hypothetical protein